MNVRSLRGKEQELMEERKRYNLGFLGISERAVMLKV